MTRKALLLLSGLVAIALAVGIGFAVGRETDDDDDKDDAPVAQVTPPVAVAPTPDTTAPAPDDVTEPVNRARAEQIAIAHVGEGRVTGAGREDDHGAMWEVEVTLPDGAEVDVYVASDGRVVHTEHH